MRAGGASSEVRSSFSTAASVLPDAPVLQRAEVRGEARAPAALRISARGAPLVQRRRERAP
eukprot:7120440-Pyramimonas_sp.AAC.1